MKYVREFEALRGLMAVWVLFGHVASTVDIHNRLFENKLYNIQAVAVFIMLSGFAITAMIDKRPEPYRYFIAKRALRIFPAYLFFLLLSVLAARFALDVWSSAPAGPMQQARQQMAEDTLAFWWPHLAVHIVGLHGLVPPRLLPSTDFAFLGQAWSVSLEWQFYLIAPFVISLVFAPLKMTRLAIILFVGVFFALTWSWMPEGYIGKWAFDFVVGIGTFYTMKHAERLDIGLILKGWAIAVALLVTTRSSFALPYLIWVTVTMLAMLSRKTDNRATGLFQAIFGTKILQALGGMAYSVYLAHMLVLIFSLRFLQDMHVVQPWIQFVLLSGMTLAGTIFISYFSHRFIEMKFHRYGQRFSSPVAIENVPAVSSPA